MFVCICKGVRESDVKRAGQLGITTPERLIVAFGLKDEECCGRCALNIDEFVDLAMIGRFESPVKSAA